MRKFDALVSAGSMEIPEMVSSKQNHFEGFETGYSVNF
jgi:hypothetical protein